MSEIESLTLRVRDLSHSIDFWNLVMIWGLAIAAVAAIVVGISTRIVIVRGRHLAGVQDLLSAAKDRQLQTDLKNKDIEIGNLKILSDTAEAQISEAKLKAAGLELEAAQLRTQLASQERRADILMNSKFRGPLIFRLKRFSGQQYDVLTCGIEESEIIYFSMSIWGTLDGAGWLSGKIENHSPSCSAGLLVMVNPNASGSTKEAAQSLLDGFIGIGLVPRTSTVANIPPPPADAGKPGTWFLESSRVDSVLISVGTHP
jgi:hypothetical protein